MAALSSLATENLQRYRRIVLGEHSIQDAISLPPIQFLEKIYDAYIMEKSFRSFPYMLPFQMKLEAALLMLAKDKSNEHASRFLSSCISQFGTKYLHGFDEEIDTNLVTRVLTNNPSDNLQEQVMAHLFHNYELQECIEERFEAVRYAQYGTNVPLFVTSCQGISILGAPSSFPLLSKETYGVISDKQIDRCAPFVKGDSIGWIHWDSVFQEESFSITARFVADESAYPIAFTLLVKADLVEIDDYGILSKASLDKYQGDISHIFLTSQENVLRVDTQGASEMQVIPLAGGDVFWGADYLIVYVAGNGGENISIKGKGIK